MNYFLTVFPIYRCCLKEFFGRLEIRNIYKLPLNIDIIGLPIVDEDDAKVVEEIDNWGYVWSLREYSIELFNSKMPKYFSSCSYIYYSSDVSVNINISPKQLHPIDTSQTKYFYIHFFAVKDEDMTKLKYIIESLTVNYRG